MIAIALKFLFTFIKINLLKTYEKVMPRTPIKVVGASDLKPW